MDIYPAIQILLQFFRELQEKEPTIKIIHAHPYDFIEEIQDRDKSYCDALYQYSLKEGKKYPEKYKELIYFYPNKIYWAWNYNVENDQYESADPLSLSGAFGLNSLSNVATGLFNFFEKNNPVAGDFIYGNDALEEGGKAYHNHYYYQRASYIASYSEGIYICWMIEKQLKGIENGYTEWEAIHESLNIDELWFNREQDFSFHKLELNLEEYINMLYLTKGAKFWQHLFVENAGSVILDEEIVRLMQMLINLPELFPNHDYSPLFKRFEEQFDGRLSNEFYQNHEYYKKLINLVNEKKVLLMKDKPFEEILFQEVYQQSLKILGKQYILPKEIIQIETHEPLIQYRILNVTLISYPEDTKTKEKIYYKVKDVQVKVLEIGENIILENQRNFQILVGEYVQHFPKGIKIVVNKEKVKLKIQE